MFFVRGQWAKDILISHVVNRISEISLAFTMPMALFLKIQQIRKKLLRPKLKCVKISRIAREIHAFEKVVRQNSGWRAASPGHVARRSDFNASS